MAIDLKNLQKVINLCRKTGVLELEVDGIRVKLTSEAPVKRKHASIKEKDSAKPQPSYSDEDMLFWSASGIEAN